LITNFCTDEVSNVDPMITDALAMFCYSNQYMSDVECRERLVSVFSDLFEADVEVFPVITEAAASAQALSSLAERSSKIYCHSESKVYADYAETVQLLAKGSEFFPLKGSCGKINLSELARVFALSQPYKSVSLADIVTISQATEFGEVYEIDEIREISELSHEHGAYVYMDGIHFSNAVASLGCHPADITWKAGIDVLTFGTTRNGTIGGEVVVFFDRVLSKGFQERCTSNGHSFEKAWFPNIQLEAHISEGLWLKNAIQANQMAKALAKGLEAFQDVRLCYSVKTNKVFAEMPMRLVQRLLSEGFQFLYSEENNLATVQLVTSFNTEPSHINVLLSSVQCHLEKSEYDVE
jgi:threonine aldolase